MWRPSRHIAVNRGAKAPNKERSQKPGPIELSKMHKLSFLLLLLLLSCQNPAPKMKEADTQVAVSFINDYFTNLNAWPAHIGYDEWLFSRNDASDGLKQRLKDLIEEAEKLDPEMGLDYDPIINGQDHPETKMVLKSVDLQTGAIVVQGEAPNQWYEIPMQMEYLDGKWLVSGCGALIDQ